MKIGINNVEKINTIINSVEKRSRVRTITHKDILEACDYIEKTLGLCKKHLEGTIFWINPNSTTFPQSYFGTPESTHVKLTYHNYKWYVLDIFRAKCGDKWIEAQYSEITRTALLKKWQFL